MENVLKSFYHVNVSASLISSKEAFEYCFNLQNNYLISLETMDELDFILYYLQNVSLQNSLSEIHLHIGLRDICYRWSSWSSGFFIVENFVRKELLKCNFFETCLVLASTKYDEDYELFAISSTNRTLYFKEINCRDQIKNAVVICECYTHLSQEQLIQNIFMITI